MQRFKPDAPVHHATFTLAREFDAPAGRVWGAFAREDLKARWFGAHGDAVIIVAHVNP